MVTTNWRSFRDLDPKISLGIGVVDIKDNEVESPELIASRIENIVKTLGAERLRYVHPDCGFWMLQRSVVGSQDARAGGRTETCSRDACLRCCGRLAGRTAQMADLSLIGGRQGRRSARPCSTIWPGSSSRPRPSALWDRGVFDLVRQLPARVTSKKSSSESAATAATCEWLFGSWSSCGWLEAAVARQRRDLHLFADERRTQSPLKWAPPLTAR